MRVRQAILLAAAVLGAAAALPARGAVGAPVAAIFYYPWYGTPARDGAWQHWQQDGAAPPLGIGSGFYPARGAYSFTDPGVLAAQMREIAAAGIGEVIVSWWGKGSVEDGRLPAVAAASVDESAELRARGHQVLLEVMTAEEHRALRARILLRKPAVLPYVIDRLPPEERDAIEAGGLEAMAAVKIGDPEPPSWGAASNGSPQ